MKDNTKVENKKTAELLDLIWELESKEDFGEEYTEALDEIKKREPFASVFGDRYESGDSIEEKVDTLLGDVKLLKRHKHDTHSGDVMVRI